MADQFRALCAELLAAIQLYTKLNHAASDMSPFELTKKLMDAMAATHAALAQPEPQPVAEGPTDDELMDIARAADLVYYMGKGRGFGSPYQEGADIEAEVLAFARAALAHWGRHTPQPVATSERLDWLRPNALPTPEATNESPN